MSWLEGPPLTNLNDDYGTILVEYPSARVVRSSQVSRLCLTGEIAPFSAAMTPLLFSSYGGLPIRGQSIVYGFSLCLEKVIIK